MKERKLYWVVWTYIANYHVTAIMAKDANDAMKYAAHMDNPDFAKKASVYVFDTKPLIAVGADAEKALRIAEREEAYG